MNTVFAFDFVFADAILKYIVAPVQVQGSTCITMDHLKGFEHPLIIVLKVFAGMVVTTAYFVAHITLYRQVNSNSFTL